MPGKTPPPKRLTDKELADIVGGRYTGLVKLLATSYLADRTTAFESIRQVETRKRAEYEVVCLELNVAKEEVRQLKKEYGLLPRRSRRVGKLCPHCEKLGACGIGIAQC